MRNRVTIRDVAERAGCSVSTVSRVLNGVGRIGEETRQRVREAAADLNFQFDPIGRSLQSRRTRILGAMIPTLSNPVFAEAVNGVQLAARRRGYQLLLSCSNYAPEEEAEAVSTLLAHRIDGLVLTVSDAEDSPAIDVALRAGAPFVLIFNNPSQPLPAVAFDNRLAAREVAERMLALGHADAAFVAGRFSSSDRSKQRYVGFCEGYAAAGAQRPALVEVDYEASSHREALRQLLDAQPGLTALFCSNDMLALKVVRDLSCLGRRVPEDVSVVGFDGVDVVSLFEPGLATVATACDQMGAEATDHLIDSIEHKSEPQDATLLLSHEFRPGRSLSQAPGGIAGSGAATPDPALIPASPHLTANWENDS